MIKKKVVIVWEGFPACGLRIEHLYKEFKEVVLFGTKPQVTFNILTKDLLDIEDGVTIGWGVDMFSHNIENGHWTYTPIHVDRSSVIGERASLMGPYEKGGNNQSSIVCDL